MPWKSDAQRKWGNSPAGHKALGDAGVNEWNKASKNESMKKSKMDKEDKKKGYSKKEEKAEKYKGKGTRARLNTAAEKNFFKSKASK